MNPLNFGQKVRLRQVALKDLSCRNFNIEKISDSYVADIAKLHKQYIASGFLSTIKISFLKLIYKSMIKSKNAVCIVALDNKEVVGFISGAVKVKCFYREFIKKEMLRSIAILIPYIAKPDVARKLLETLFYPVKQDKDFPDAELLSIVVKDNYRGKGLGECLFKELIREFHEMNVTQFKAVVGSNLVSARKFYEKMNGFLQAEIQIHKNTTSQLYTWEI